ncbi:MAG: hypothetical protein MUD14_18880 [Hydrococcus sp. Prado102]|jgi:hypothetical protein|nr:hypothetical protein [Hydrococcus sp. Prado102]
MTNPASSAPSFLRDAFKDYATYNNLQKQDVHKRALKWLQLHINTKLADKTIIEQFTQKWRVGIDQTPASDTSPLYLEYLPSSYGKTNSINDNHENALVFIQEVVPLQMQEDFKQRWNVKTKLEISNSSGTSFKIDERDITLLQQEDPDGKGTTWYQVENKSIYYLLSSEPKGDDLLVVLGEEIGSQNCNTWFVAQEHVKVSNI